MSYNTVTFPSGVRAGLAVAAIVVALLAGRTQAQDITWTGATDGTWDTTTQNWKVTATGVPVVYADGDNVSFTDDVPNKTINIVAAVTPASITFNAGAGVAYAISGAGIAGAASLTASGAGTLTLSGAGIAYTGATTVTAGKLVLQDTTNQANAASPATFDIGAGGALEFAVSNGVTKTLGSTATTRITGSGTLIKSGPGLLTFNQQGGNQFVVVIQMTGGLIDVQGGTLRNGGWQGQDWTANKSSLNVAAGATFDPWDGNDVYVDALTGSGSVNRGTGGPDRKVYVGVNNGSGDFSGILNFGAAFEVLVKTGSGTQTLSGSNDNDSGRATVNAGTLVLSKASNGGVHAVAGIFGVAAGATLRLAGTGNDQIYNGGPPWGVTNMNGTFDLAGTNEEFSQLTGTGLVTNSVAASTSRLLVGASDASSTFDGIIENGAGTTVLQKNGNGTFTLTNASTYTGETYIDRGTLLLAGGANRLSPDTYVNVSGNAGTTLDLNGNDQTVRWIQGGNATGGVITNSNATTLSTLTLNLLTSGGRDYNGVLSGNLRLVVKDSGTKNNDVLTLNTANSYTGGTVIDNGQLRVVDDSFLGAVPGAFDPANITMLNDGVLQNNNSFLVLNANRGIFLSTAGSQGTFFCGWGKDITVNGAISGPGGIYKSDGGRLILNAANTFGGDTVFWDRYGTGTIVVGNTLALQNSTFDATGIGSNGTLDLNNMDVVLGGLKGNGAGINNFSMQLSVGNNNQPTSFGGSLGGTGSFVKIGTGILTLNGGNIAYTGNTTVNGGRLVLQNTTGFARGGAGAQVITIAGGTTLEIATVTRDIDFGSGPGVTITGNGTLLKTGGLRFGSEVGWTQPLYMAMTGGLIDIQDGTVRNGGYSNTDWTNNKSSMNIAGPAIFDMWDGLNMVVVDALTGSGTITKSGGGETKTLTVGVNGGGGLFSGIIVNPSGVIALVKQGAGTLTLTGANTYSGSTTVSAGALHLMGDYDRIESSSSITVENGAVLSCQDWAQHIKALTLNGGTLAGSGDATYGSWILDQNVTVSGGVNTSIIGAIDVALNVAGGTTFTVNGGAASGIDLNVTGTIGDKFLGSNGLIKTGAGTMALANVNTYSGNSTVLAGTLLLGNDNAIPSGAGKGNVIVIAGTLDLNGHSIGINGLTGAGIVDNMSGAGAYTLSVGDNDAGGAFSGSIRNTTGTLSLIKVGAGTEALAGTNTYGGTTTIDAGTLRVAGSAPGLLEGRVNGAFNRTDPNPATSVQLTTRYANIHDDSGPGYPATAGAWADNTTFVYSGYINNPTASDVTYTFAENFDDSVLLTIDGITPSLLDNGNWGQPTIGTYALTPGYHSFELRLGQGNGGVGPSNNDWLNNNIGFGYDPLGRGQSGAGFAGNYVVMTDPGDGSLFVTQPLPSNVIPDTSAVVVNGGTLDLSVGTKETIGSLSGAAAGGVVLNTASNLTTGGLGPTTFAGVISGAGGLTKVGATTFTLTGVNTHTGAMTVSAGVLQVGDGLTSGTLAPNSIVNNASLVFNNPTDISYDGRISGTGSLTKIGAGVLTLGGVSTYTGATLVNESTLRLAAPSNPIAGSVLHLDATDVATITKDAGNRVSQWSDAAGGLDSLSQGTASRQPVYTPGVLNNWPVIRFTAARQTFLNNATNYPAPATVIYLGRMTGGANGRLVSTFTNNWLLGYNGGFMDRAYFEGWVNQPNAAVDTNFHIYEGVITGAGTNTSFYKDGVLLASNQGGVTGPNGLELGGFNGPNETSNGDIAEVLVFNRAITDAERKSIESYLLAKWSGVLPPNTAVTVAVNATLDVNGNSQTIGSLAGAANSAVTLGGGMLATGNNGADTAFAGVISEAGGLTKIGTGTFTLSGANTYGGQTTINGGILTAAGGSAIPDTGAVVIADVAGAVLNLAANETVGSLAGGGTTGGDVTLGANTLTVGTDNTDTTYSGDISGAGGLTKIGTGVITLAGSNSYGGATTINDGTVRATGIQPGLLQGWLAGGSSNAPQPGNRGFVLLPEKGEQFAAGTPNALSGWGTNETWVYTGRFYVPPGVNTLAFAGSIDDGWYLSFNGTAYHGWNWGGNTGVINVTPDTLYDIDIRFQNGGGDAGASGGTNWGGNLPDTVLYPNLPWRKGFGYVFNPGAIDLNDANNFTVPIDNGSGSLFSLPLPSSNSIPDGSAVVMNGGTLDVVAFTSETIGSLAGVAGTSVVLNAGTTLTTGGTGGLTTFAGVISGTGELTKDGAGTFTLTGVNTYSGVTTISAGALEVGDGTVPGTGTFMSDSVVDNASLIFNNAADISYAGPITGTGMLTMDGSAILTLNGLNTFSGGATINSGEIVTEIALGTGSVTLNGGTWGLATAADLLAGFGGTGAGWQLNNGATVAADVLTLTENVTGQSRSAFSATMVPVNAGFTASFVYTVGGDAIADGMAFVLQRDPRGLTARGDGGGALGYGGGAYIANSDAIEFNIYAPNTIGTAHQINGATGGYASSAPVNLASRNPILVTVTYDPGATTTTVVMTDQVTAATKTVIYSGVNLAATVGNTTAYVGFTGGTGGAAAIQTISNFRFAATPQYGNNVIAAPGVTTGGLEMRIANAGLGTLDLGNGAALNVTSAALGLDVPYTLTAGAATMAGANVFSVVNNGLGTGTLVVGGMAGTGPLTKTGDGTLVLAGDGAYSGATNVNQGSLDLTVAYRYFRFTPTVLRVDATPDVQLSEMQVFSNGLQVTGATATNPGGNNPGAETPPMAVDNNTNTKWLDHNRYPLVLDFGKPVPIDAYRWATADDASERDPVRWRFEGSNDNVTWTMLDDQTAADYPTPAARSTYLPMLALGSSHNGIPDTSAVQVAAGASFNLNGLSETIGSLDGAAGSSVGLGLGTLTTGGDNSTTVFGGVISGTGGLVKQGSGAMTLGGANTYAGATSITGGTLLVDGAIGNGAVTVALNTTLGGTGTIGNGGVTVNGTMSPGDAGPGLLTVAGSVTFGAGSTFVVQLDGAVAGTGYDQLSVGGSVILGDATLNATLGFVPTNNTPFTLITHTAGTTAPQFGGLPQGNEVVIGGRSFVITYNGGAGSNDVVLTTQLKTFTWTGGGASDNWSDPANWAGGLAPSQWSQVVFGALAPRPTPYNNFLGYTFDSIGFDTAGFAIGGNALTLASGSAALDNNVAGTNTVGMPITFIAAPQTITTAAGGVLNVTGAISGTVGVTKQGLGTLTLTGANNYSAGTTVSAGTLQGDTAGLQGNITNNAAVVFNQTVAGTYAGAITGSGSVTVQGAGAVVRFTGVNAYAGATTVANGATLLVNGSIGNTAVTVMFGATLGGTGAIGNAGVTVNGTLSPGDGGIGMLTVSGAVTFNAGSTFSVQLDGTLGADQLAAASVTVDNAAALAVALPAPTAHKQAFTILDNTGGGAVSGTFAGLANHAAFTAGGRPFIIRYDGGTGNDIVLTDDTAPTATGPANVTTNEDTPITITMQGNDAEPDTLTFVVTPVNLQGGSLSVVTPGPDSDQAQVTYTPAANYNDAMSGPASFTFMASDGVETTAPFTVTVAIAAVNDPPQLANPGSQTGTEDTAGTVTITGIQPGPTTALDELAAQGVALSVSASIPAAFSSLTVTPAVNAPWPRNATVSYTPAVDWNGPVDITVTANDGQLLNNTAPVTFTLTITPVNDPPQLANPGAQSGTEDTPGTVNITGIQPGSSTALDELAAQGVTMSVLASIPAAFSSLTIAPVSSPWPATATLSYTPALNWNGSVDLTVTANDGQASNNTASVTFTLDIAAVNDPPVAVNDAYSIPKTRTLTVPAPGVLANDTDVEITRGELPAQTLTAILDTGPTGGTLTSFNADGSFTYVAPAAPGIYTFTYYANDGIANSLTPATVTITVINNVPPVASDDTYAVNEDTTLNVAAPGVLSNDTDENGDMLTVVLGAGPANAQSFALNPDGSFVYTPVANYFGPDRFTYRVNDGLELSTNIATVNITVNPVNDQPVVQAQSVFVGINGSLTIVLTGTDVANENQALTFTIASAPVHGTLGAITQVTPWSASVVYSPSRDYAGADSFTFTAIDNGMPNLTSSPATVAITVTPPPSFDSAPGLMPNPVVAGQPITGAAAAGTAAITWDFGDGTSVTGLTVSHIYTQPGIYTVTITATSTEGVPTVLTAQVFVGMATTGTAGDGGAGGGAVPPGVTGILIGGTGQGPRAGGSGKVICNYVKPEKSSITGSVGTLAFPSTLQQASLTGQGGVLTLGTGATAQKFLFSLNKSGRGKATSLPAIEVNVKKARIKFKVNNRPDLVSMIESLGGQWVRDLKKSPVHIVYVSATVQVGNSVFVAMTFQMKYRQVGDKGKGTTGR